MNDPHRALRSKLRATEHGLKKANAKIVSLQTALERFIEECEGVGSNHPPSDLAIKEAHTALGSRK